MIGKRTAVAGFLISTILISGTGGAQQRNTASVQVVATAQLSRWMAPEPKEVIYATLAFISEDSLALNLRRPSSTQSCRLVVLQLGQGSLAAVAQTDTDCFAGSLFRSSEGSIVSTVPFKARLHSRDLAINQTIPYPSRISVSGNTVAVFDGIYRVPPVNSSIERISSVSGKLEAISDDLLAIREQDVIRTETMDGRLLGSFKVKPATKCYTQLEIADKERLYLNTCGRDRMVDFKGKELVRLRDPDGWGFRHGWSADGKRLLYDHYTRTVPFLGNLGSNVLAAVTLGIGVGNEDANGEAIRVVDTVSGNICFDWKDPKHLRGEGDFHADISPSGKLVAMVAGGTLSIYRLPDSCTKN